VIDEAFCESKIDDRGIEHRRTARRLSQLLHDDEDVLQGLPPRVGAERRIALLGNMLPDHRNGAGLTGEVNAGGVLARDLTVLYANVNDKEPLCRAKTSGTHDASIRHSLLHRHCRRPRPLTSPVNPAPLR